MMIQPTRFVTCLGLLAGSLAIAGTAHADIPITGGQVTGQSAFFTQTNVPTTTGTTLTRTGQPVLFDTVIQTLRIATPNGTTTTSRFLPNAASFSDVNGNSRPDSGDTGILKGGLSGVAFNQSGFPVFFQNIPTTLNFTLTSFTPVFTDPGSLINPRQEGTAPLLFLPGVNVRLSDVSNTTFQSRFGILETGAFAANLTGDFIGLPSDLQLRPASTDVTLVPVVLGRRIKFDFEGRDAAVDEASFTNTSTSSTSTTTSGTSTSSTTTSTSSTSTTTSGTSTSTSGSDSGELSFAGEVTNFQVQSVGTPGTREFKVTGSGTLDITLTGPFDIKRDSLDLNGLTSGQTLNYRIKGEGPGFVAFTSANSVAYSGTSRRDTQFKFERGDRSFEGRSAGDVSFVVNDRQDNVDFNDPNFSFTVPVVGIGATTTPSGAPFVSITSLPTGGTVSSSSTSTSTSTFVFTTTVFNTNSITIFPGYRSLLVERSGEDQDDDNQGYSSNVVYYVYAPKKLATEVVIERQGDLLLVVDRTPVRGRKLKKRGQVVSAYQVVGLPSRVFPGLTGLRQIPADQVSTISTNEATGTSTGGTTTEGTATSTQTSPGTTTNSSPSAAPQTTPGSP